MDKGKEIVYELIDCEGLSTCLAEEDWKKETKNVKNDDLYELVAVSPEGGKVAEVQKQVVSKWSTLFFNIKQEYLSLIRTFSKKEEDKVVH